MIYNGNIFLYQCSYCGFQYWMPLTSNCTVCIWSDKVLINIVCSVCIFQRFYYVASYKKNDNNTHNMYDLHECGTKGKMM